MRKLRLGGDLHPGDFIAVSEGNRMFFGWYFGDGIGGTLQYYYLHAPSQAYQNYEEWLKKTPEAKKASWYNKKFETGFSLKCMWKSYINAVHDTRVMKITNAEEIFTNPEDRETYEKSKEVLIKLNFVKP